jgi:predicted transcriptional regulator
LKKRGRKHTPGEIQLMSQVARVFTAKLEEKGGAKKAAKELGISLASFYKYASGDDLPRMEVLREAQEKWEGVKWELIDVSQITKKKKIMSPEQYVLSFLQEVRTEDVEIAKIGPKGERILQVLLNIRFPA